MAKLQWITITAYKRYSDYSIMTYASEIDCIKINHGRKEILFILPKSYGQYECEGHYCEIMTESEFNKKYTLERN